MEAREHWQALQSRLTAARKSLERGDRGQALADVDAALAIDPSFLAAVALRERIVSNAETRTESSAIVDPDPPIRNPLPAPLVSPDGYAKFEQRARRRRVDRKIEQARQAIAERRLREAATALNEVIELDPNLPELAPLTASFDDLRRRHRANSHRGPALAAAAVFGVMVFGATWFHEGGVLLSRPMSAIASLVQPSEPEPIVVPEVAESTPVATTGGPERLPEAAREPAAVAAPPESRRTLPIAPDSLRMPPVAPPPSSAPSEPAPAPRTIAPAPQPMIAPQSRVASPPANTPVALPPSISAGASPIAIAPTATAAVAPVVNVPKPAPAPPPAAENAESQIDRALQQYRSAYEDLDATRARAVWPAVNEAALARAFDSLESQTLTFEGCRFDVHGDEAVARCHGSARYVPKIGSREPRTEPRNWTFALRRAGGEWKIESARAERGAGVLRVSAPARNPAPRTA